MNLPLRKCCLSTVTWMTAGCESQAWTEEKEHHNHGTRLCNLISPTVATFYFFHVASFPLYNAASLSL